MNRTKQMLRKKTLRKLTEGEGLAGRALNLRLNSDDFRASDNAVGATYISGKARRCTRVTDGINNYFKPLEIRNSFYNI